MRRMNLESITQSAESQKEENRKCILTHIQWNISQPQKGTLESVLMRRMNLESITQSAESQKEENRKCILTHIHGI